MPPLGHDNSGSTTIKTAYLNMMEDLHTATVSSNGQWERAKTYGSQIWPDVVSLFSKLFTMLEVGHPLCIFNNRSNQVF